MTPHLNTLNHQVEVDKKPWGQWIMDCECGVRCVVPSKHSDGTSLSTDDRLDALTDFYHRHLT